MSCTEEIAVAQAYNNDLMDIATLLRLNGAVPTIDSGTDAVFGQAHEGATGDDGADVPAPVRDHILVRFPAVLWGCSTCIISTADDVFDAISISRPTYTCALSAFLIAGVCMYLVIANSSMSATTCEYKNFNSY